MFSVMRGDSLRFCVDRVGLPTGERFTPDDVDAAQALFRGGVFVDVDAVRDGSRWVVSLPAAKTETMPAGRYRIYFRFTQGEDVRTVLYDDLTVLPDVDDTATGEDPLSRAQKALEAAEEALANFKAGKRVQAYSIDGRSMTFASSTEILAIVKYWRKRVRVEAGKASRLRTVYRVRF